MPGTTPDPSAACSRCGAAVPAGARECPRCLLELGLNPPAPASGTAESAKPRSEPLVSTPPSLDEVRSAFPDLDIDDRHQPRLDNVARSSITLKLGDGAEQGAWQKHRVAALAVMGGAHDRLAAGLAESRDEMVEIRDRDAGHVAKYYQRSAGSVRNSKYAGLERS